MIRIRIDEDLELREIHQRDRKKIYDVVDDNRVFLKRWLPWLNHTKSPHSYLSVIKSWQQNIEMGTGMELGLFYHDEFIGMCGFTTIDPNSRRAQIGYWLAQEYEGRGLMLRTVKGLINYGFSDMGLNRIEIVCGEKNVRSRKLPEALGFTPEGTMKDYEFLYDHYHDCILYRMLKSEWPY